MGFGKIVLLDTHDKRASISVDGCADLAALVTFGTAIANYTHGTILEESYSEQINVGGSPSTGDIDSVEAKAVCEFRDLAATGKPKVRKIQIPAPVESMFEGKKDQGARVIQATGEAIATAINTAIGTNWQFIRGYLEAKRLFKSI